MKKIIIFSMFALVAIVAKAQDFKKVQNATLLNRYEDAKTEIDKLMADPKALGNAETYLWKAKVYGTLSNSSDEKIKAKYPTAFATADEAFTKYVEMDPTFKILKDNNLSDAATNIYSTSYKDGVKAFNAKAWDSASYHFNYAVKYSDYLFKNKLLKSEAAFDTTSILYAGYSAQNALKVDDAVKYYTRLMDAKVADTSNIELYKYVLLQNIKKKEKATFDKYLAISRTAFPKEAWEDYEMEYINKNLSLTDKVAMYDKEAAAGTLTASKYIQFADLFAYIPKEDKDKMDSITLDSYNRKALDAFKKAADLDAKDGIAHFNTGIIYYTLYGVYEDRVIENRKMLKDVIAAHVVEKDLKKKIAAEAKFKQETDAIKKLSTDLEKPMTDCVDGCIVYIEKSYNILKDKKDLNNIEKTCLRKSVDFLANMYAIKRDKSAGKDPKAYDVYEAKYKLYDGLHK
jgi:hypothetical protein